MAIKLFEFEFEFEPHSALDCKPILLKSVWTFKLDRLDRFIHATIPVNSGTLSFQIEIGHAAAKIYNWKQL